jgi:flagellar hook assembly protein FlgD
VTVRVQTPQGIVLRRVTQATYQSGQISVGWNGIRKDGRPAYGGLYEVVVTAQNGIGTVSLEEQLRIRRIAAKR